MADVIKKSSFANELTKQKKAKLTIKYSNKSCVFCLISLKKHVIEDTSHIFSSCPQQDDSNTQLYLDILNIINSKTQRFKLKGFPCWFTCGHPSLAASNIERSLLEFPKKLGDMGYIPKGLKKWIKELLPKKQAKPTILEIVIAIQLNCKNKWIKRCNFLADNYKEAHNSQITQS